MPKYLFAIRNDLRHLLRDTAIDCEDQKAACAYAKQVVRELQEDGYNHARLIMTVKDAEGELLFLMPFVWLSGPAAVDVPEAHGSSAA